jgi:hypothetical protein
VPRRDPLERVYAWLVTGPVGRLLAFFADLAGFWWRRLRGRSAGRGVR